LPGLPLGEGIAVSADMAALASATELVVLAVPSAAMRSTVRAVAGTLPDAAVLLSVAKGIEGGTLLRMSEVIAEEARGPAGRVAVLSGPTLAPEIARGLPAGAVVASGDEAVARRVSELLGGPTLRLYRNSDVVGVELAGALKNIVAIVAGAVDRLGAGDNAKAAMTTRGLAEMTRLGVAMGANPLTFAGLAGIGDILATCSSSLSRNHQLGMELAGGRTWADVEGTLPGVAEGAYTVGAAIALAERHGVDMPIAREVHAVLYESKDVRSSVADLLARESKEELAGLA
jgi:glycerol-3-phosphate dehydrogenase (NAD(P)+)